MRLIDADALYKMLSLEADDYMDLGRFERARGIESALCAIKYAPTVGGWVSVKDRLPAETHSIFYPWFGKKQWNKAMWREQSDKVLVTVPFKDGTRIVTTGETHDGVWNTTISRTLEPVVTHWMPLPEPPKEENNAKTDRR